MAGDKIDTSNNISPYIKRPQDYGIKNYFLEAQKKAAALGEGVKKKMPPIFNDYLQANASSNAGFVQPGNANYLGTTNK